MTFKHSKFEDSVTMRSLEKLAREKGWVKSEPPMTKSASSQPNLMPSGSFVENVLKLCSGLRSAGYEKYASELENKLVNYKQAQTLYETSKEKGDDLVHAAHPKGSHKLENVEGDEAVFEDIIDKHLKHVQVVEKQPTGKLASSRDVISAVKVVLGQTAQDQMAELMAQLKSLTQQVVNLTEADLTVSWSYKAGEINDLAKTPTIDNLKKIKGLISQQRMRLEPGGLVFSGISEDSWIKVQPKLDEMDKVVDGALKLRGQILTEAPAASKESVATKLNNAIDQNMNNLDFWKRILDVAIHTYSPEQKATASKYIEDQKKELQEIKNKLVNEPDPNKYSALVEKLTKESNDFYVSWIKDKQ